MKYFLLVLGLIIAAIGAILYTMSNFNLGILMTILLGIVFFLWGLFYEKTKTGILKIFRNVFVVSLCLELVFVGFLGCYGNVDNTDYTEDAVIVLGAGVRGDQITMPLWHRLTAAVSYHEKNPDAYIVVTGGQGAQETVTEAYAMEKYLIKRGVDPDKIIKEEQATSTEENMRFSKAILDEKLGNDYSVVVITNHFHIYRGVAIAQKEGFLDVTHMHGGLEWYNVIPNYLRETLAVLKMWIID